MEKVFKIDDWNNFCRIFELPQQFSSEYCFNGGIDTNFKMIDWFNPITIGDGFQPAVAKEVWIEEVGEYDTEEITLPQLQDKLIDFLCSKKYIKEDRKYLFLSSFGATFLFNKDGIVG